MRHTGVAFCPAAAVEKKLCWRVFVWVWALVHAPSETGPGAGQREIEGRGIGSGSYPLQARVEYDGRAISWAKSWESGCVGEQEAPAGVWGRWDPGAACWTDWFNSQFCQAKLKCLLESPGQKLMKPPAFTGWIKPCSGEMMHTKLSSHFFLLANYRGSISITLWEGLVFLSPPVK